MIDVLSVISDLTLGECLDRCSVHGDCHSINYKPNNCYLNRYTADTGPLILESESTIYAEYACGEYLPNSIKLCCFSVLRSV